MGKRWDRFWRNYDRKGGMSFWWFPIAIVLIFLVTLLSIHQGYGSAILDWLDRLVH